ncbi:MULTISPECIES: M23 family metallopeptidase [unclassified Crossiella]|uniref:M23 family metallopeptidase n=1 Tax=unclassified Crossiella TaxID=2620835 RepID=UPI001FFF25D5|nr:MULTISPECIES: M23 family metallopeptidase [unclassified Crossiella]MCK2240512.1 M23 family metallopeptidase [Crossiella sp. S99.2]MCK2253037.1 M23 family metallopeptidase [Crossiella sp. S99.1]
MKIRRVVAAGVGLLLATATAVVLAPAAQAAGPRPSFQLPFPCGQAWNGDNDNSSAHRAYEIDFNRGSSAGADKGDTVTAAAAGKIITSAHQGSANGYGNLVVIDHGGGWRTYYAHLDVRSVGAGAQVSRGQKIGTVGNTSKPGNNISPHLHYEVRTTDTSYPGNIQPAYFNGARFGYPNQTLTSRNCGGSSNPYDAVEVCGAGYGVVDTASLGAAGSVQLLFNAANGNNCVVTLKSASVGTASAVSAYLEVQGAARSTDSGSFEYYAGPVRKPADNKCVKWGGSVGSAAYNSPFEHCG